MRHECFSDSSIADHSLPLDGPIFDLAQRTLSRFNQRRLTPGIGAVPSPEEQTEGREALALEAAFVNSVRNTVAAFAAEAPSHATDLVRWFERLRENGFGQGDALFPYLAERATRDEMIWFLQQEAAGEAGFDDLVAYAQVKMPARAKLEMARNYWDEMGRGQAKGMHGPMLDRLIQYFGIEPAIEKTVPESLALGNMMVALACNRHYAFHAIGALGVIELTAPTRAVFVAEGLRRLGVPAKQSHYFSLHAVLDVKHSESWNSEVLETLIAEDGRRAPAIAEGALLRLWCGRRCFERYRNEFGLS